MEDQVVDLICVRDCGSNAVNSKVSHRYYLENLKGLTSRLRRRTAIVTLPIAGTYMLACCLTESESKFLSLEKLIQTAPSRNKLVSTLYCFDGTPLITTSLRYRHSSKDFSGIGVTAWRTFFKPRPRENNCVPSRSIEKTFAPSFASKAARGLPTTSERLITVIVLPCNRLP